MYSYQDFLLGSLFKFFIGSLCFILYYAIIRYIRKRREDQEEDIYQEDDMYIMSDNPDESHNVDTTDELHKETITQNVSIEQIAIPENSAFDLNTFHRAANADYLKRNTKKMAFAAKEIAQLINDNFDKTQEIRCMVPALQIDPEASQNTLPVHFLFVKDGQPKVAIVVVTKNGYKHPYVVATKNICEKRGITYLRVFATGSFADWIEGKASPEVTNMCKSRIVKQINKVINIGKDA